METRTKRDLILDAFRELLENEDIQHISVNEIAKKAGIGKGSIYYYFSSKDEISFNNKPKYGMNSSLLLTRFSVSILIFA